MRPHAARDTFLLRVPFFSAATRINEITMRGLESNETKEKDKDEERQGVG